MDSSSGDKATVGPTDLGYYPWSNAASIIENKQTTPQKTQILLQFQRNCFIERADTTGTDVLGNTCSSGVEQCSPKRLHQQSIVKSNTTHRTKHYLKTATRCQTSNQPDLQFSPMINNLSEDGLVIKNLRKPVSICIRTNVYSYSVSNFICHCWPSPHKTIPDSWTLQDPEDVPNYRAHVNQTKPAYPWRGKNTETSG